MPCKEIDLFDMSGSCSSEWLGGQLMGGRELLLLDCRPHGEYCDSHVEGAIHVALPTLMLRRLKKGNLSVSSVINCNESRTIFDQKCRTVPVVLYDDSQTDNNANPTSIVGLLARKLKEDGCCVCVLAGGFTEFSDQHPHLCISNKETAEDSTIVGLRSLRISECDAVDDAEDSGSGDQFPVEVLQYLFLGNAKNSGDMECLNKHNILYILNVTHNVPNTFEENGKFRYMQISIKDHWSQNLSVFFPQAIAFIDEARQNKCGVLVHCLAGISRSVTVTVAYLMHKLQLTLNDAYDFVKRCKPNISPNFNFMGQLLDFERTLNVSARKCHCQHESCDVCAQHKTFFMTPTKTTPTYELESPVVQS